MTEMLLTYLMGFTIDAWERSIVNQEKFDNNVRNNHQLFELDNLDGISLGELRTPRIHEHWFLLISLFPFLFFKLDSFKLNFPNLIN